MLLPPLLTPLAVPRVATSQNRDRLAERVNFVRQKAVAATSAATADLEGPAILGGFDLEAFGGAAGVTASSGGTGATSAKTASDLHVAAQTM